MTGGTSATGSTGERVDIIERTVHHILTGIVLVCILAPITKNRGLVAEPDDMGWAPAGCPDRLFSNYLRNINCPQKGRCGGGINRSLRPNLTK